MIVTIGSLTEFQAAQIQLAPSDYEAFLTNQDIPDSGENLDPQAFSARFVMPLGKEAGRSILVGLSPSVTDGRCSRRRSDICSLSRFPDEC